MSTLQIIKLQSGAFKHIDSIDGEFFLGRFNFKQEFNKAFLVEAYGAKRREYTILDISVFDYLGSAETFTNFTDLINRLTELGYTGIETNGILPTSASYISTDVDNALELGTDSKLFVPPSAGDFLSNDETTYTAATLPLTGTELALVEQGGTFKKVAVSEFGGGGGTSDIVIDLQNGSQTQITTTERVASIGASDNLFFNTNVTKSGLLLTGPYEMMAKRVLKNSTAKKLTYRYFPDGNDLTIELRIYAFKQNKDSTSIFDCRLLLEETLTSGGAYTIQKYEFLTADFFDSNLIEGEFLAFTMKKTTSLGNLFLYSQDLTLTY